MKNRKHIQRIIELVIEHECMANYGGTINVGNAPQEILDYLEYEGLLAKEKEDD